jgi:trimeric autotransporter adhesin
MRRFLTLVFLLCLAIPAGISVTGCIRNPAAAYCNGAGNGMKITDVATITLQPATTGISIAYGQTRQEGQPLAVTCKGAAAGVGIYTWGTTNNQLVDISPGGNICAGTWNRNLGGGIADYTICTAPNPLPSTGGLPYASAFITASAHTVSSNPVEVYVHPQVTSVSLVTTPLSGSAQQCFSQNSQATLDAQACYAGANNTQYVLCAPASVVASGNYACPGGVPAGVTSIPNCTAAIGTLGYSVANSAIASIITNTTTNQVTIEANQPGTTPITASVALSGSSAGYFSTCPPASISLTLANGETSGIITQGVTQNLVTTVTDTLGNPITGLSLDYQSTDPVDITAASGGAITTAFPGVASVFAICQASSCNPSPINEVGEFGTGLSVSSNPVKITTPGTASDYVWFSAPGQSQYFGSIDLLTGAVGSTVRLPYVPNSMMMDRLGNSLYFGSAHEMMTVNTATNAVTSENTNLPGVVLAVSPNGAQILVNDQQQKVFYLAGVNGLTTFGGMGNAAAWTPDSKTLYITDNEALNNPALGITGHSNKLYVYNQNNWTTYDLPSSPLTNPLPPGILPPNVPPTPLPPNVAISSTMQTPAITIPSVGAYLRGSPTEAHTWCPSGTVGDYASMENSFYPLGDTVVDAANDPVQTDALAATTDGQHILGAAVTGSGVTLSDIGVSIPALNCLPPATIGVPPAPNPDYSLVNGDTLSPLLLSDTVSTKPVNVKATAINQVVASPESNLAFITYTADATNTNAQLPYYVPGSAAVDYISLTGGSAISAPLAGAFTPDDKLFFVSTAGDNMIHYISVATLTDTQQISPNLPVCTPISAGGIDAGCTVPSTSPSTIVPATAIAVKPRSTT